MYFAVCDALMNDLWSSMLNNLPLTGEKLPTPFFDIYEAFDAGEYHGKVDKSDDPVSDFTRPMIAGILNSQDPR